MTQKSDDALLHDDEFHDSHPGDGAVQLPTKFG